MLSHLDRLVAGNEGAISRSLANVETFSKTLADAAPAMSSLVKAVDGNRLARVVDNPRAFVRSANYFGPDRRRKADPNYNGPRRRVADDPDADLPGRDR